MLQSEDSCLVWGGVIQTVPVFLEKIAYLRFPVAFACQIFQQKWMSPSCFYRRDRPYEIRFVFFRVIKLLHHAWRQDKNVPVRTFCQQAASGGPYGARRFGPLYVQCRRKGNPHSCPDRRRASRGTGRYLPPDNLTGEHRPADGVDSQKLLRLFVRQGLTDLEQG